MAKYTEQELRGLRCGRFIKSQTGGWDDKVILYKETDTFELYIIIKKSYKKIFWDCNGVLETMMPDQITQFLIDNYLIRKARGERVERPLPLGEGLKAEKQKTSAKDDLYERTLFDEEAFEADSDPVREITWIYNNLYIKDVDPKDAPTPGAYSYLVWTQSSSQNRGDFLKTTYPKIIPSKAQQEKGGKANDDGRPITELIERLLGEIARDKKEIPTL